MESRLWVLGAPDPEMLAIESLLRDAGERVEYALAEESGERVSPREMYRAQCPAAESLRLHGGLIVLVECDLADPAYGTHSPEHTDCDAMVLRLDHHRPGDPGHGRPPAEFFGASSLGQVISLLGRQDRIAGLGWDHNYPAPAYPRPGQIRVDSIGGWWVDAHRIPAALVLVAAADHCLGAAYRGECPGVDPTALLAWRIRTRAEFQDVSPTELRARIEAARAEIRYADIVELAPGVTVRDMRRTAPIPELVEAAMIECAAYLSGPLTGPDGRSKITCSGRWEHVDAFMRCWAPAQLSDVYGDPARGFAGGYLPEI